LGAAYTVYVAGADSPNLPAQKTETTKAVEAGTSKSGLTKFAEKTSKGDGKTEKKERAARPVAPGETLPNQGKVTGGVDGAPSVDAGKQGKHVPGHNSESEGKSKWDEGENGVKETQEAWQNGTTVKPDGSVRVGKSSDGRKVKVHQDKNGNIHGYPVGQ